MSIQTARDFLADNNLAIRGARGKLSNDAKLFLAKAINAGTKFSDWDENGKIKIEPVRKPKAKDLRQAARMEQSADVKMVDSDDELDASEIKATRWVKPERKPHADLVPVREENVINVIDDRGTLIVQSHCRESHPIRSCSCKIVMPASYLNAQSFELAVSAHA